MKTLSARAETVEQGWYVVDADGQVLGRLAVELARRLRGKHKPRFTPHVDTGDHIVVLNAEKVRVTGRKRKQKTYYRHTGYIGNLKSITFDKQIEKDARRVIEHAVEGMLPKGPLGRAMLRKLRVYNGAEHPHAAQQPEELKL
ncbi:MAG: 50S ribosomal protein L13 [Gammaproteobacteria bacterium]|nr:50S ribosomal protein L13 [Gammaproteobacteria bacterium]